MTTRPESYQKLVEAAREVLAEIEDSIDLDENDRSTSGRVPSWLAFQLRAALEAVDREDKP